MSLILSSHWEFYFIHSKWYNFIPWCSHLINNESFIGIWEMQTRKFTSVYYAIKYMYVNDACTCMHFSVDIDWCIVFIYFFFFVVFQNNKFQIFNLESDLRLQKWLYCFRLKCFSLEMDTLDPEPKADAHCKEKHCVIQYSIYCTSP